MYQTYFRFNLWRYSPQCYKMFHFFINQEYPCCEWKFYTLLSLLLQKQQQQQQTFLNISGITWIPMDFMTNTALNLLDFIISYIHIIIHICIQNMTIYLKWSSGWFLLIKMKMHWLAMCFNFLHILHISWCTSISFSIQHTKSQLDLWAKLWYFL